MKRIINVVGHPGTDSVMDDPPGVVASPPPSTWTGAQCRAGGICRRAGRVAAGRQIRPDELLTVALFAEGLPVDAIARRTEVSERTVRRRMRALCDRLGVQSAVQAAVWAVRHGLI
ncbi:response regulator transcription factor [Streptomyces sp. CA-111067]|uniref:response regulator transcription factor n=1 Tax=Streptomyces sp. CA-111067 TaxID=3240046 RepID=UPI003D95F4E7